MQLIAETAEHGVLVVKNATNLDGALANSESDTSVGVREEVPALADEATIIVGGEEMTIASGGGTTVLTVVRNAGGIMSAHADGATVRLDGGTTLLTHTFNGSEVFSAIRCGGEVEATFQIVKTASGVSVHYTATTSPDRLELFLPSVRYTPTAGTVISVLVWTWNPAKFWAEVQS